MVAELIPKVPSIPIHVVRAGNLSDVFNLLTPAQINWAQEQNFSAKLGELLVLPDEDGAVDAVLFGIGNDKERKRDRLHFGKLADTLPSGNYHLNIDKEHRELAALGWLLSSYVFDKHKVNMKAFPKLVQPDDIDSTRINIIAKSAHMGMELINRPANDLNTLAFEEFTGELAAEIGAEFKSISGTQLQTMNFPLIEAVGRASDYPPRLLEMNWGDKTKPKITLVGKGVCFDTGGLNVKPGSSMGLMKKDMGGAANVLALARMIIETNLPINLRVLLPLAENSISGNAFRPSDILKARNGMTVEVNNTDAEGRLILADALSYGAEDNPELMISMATLTGAARVAVGPDIAPYFTDDDKLREALMKHGQKNEDPVWPLPFWTPYEPMIEPDFADLDNAPSGGMAGAITAALFLRRFVGKVNYLHMDIYGWTPHKLPGRPKGGAVQGARAVFGYLEEKYGEN